MYNKPVIAPRPGADKLSSASAPPFARRANGTKEALTAWERWEMTAIAEDADPLASAPEPKPAPVVAPLKPEVLINDVELAQLRLQALQAGEAEGFRQGYSLGHARGRDDATAEVHAEAAQLRALALALPEALRGAEQEISENLMALALDIARQVLGQALALNTEAILPVVRELLQAEPALSGAPQLVLHPDDAALVREHLAEDLQAAGWRIRTDAACQRGGCRVLAASGEQDATLPSRWERVTAALAKKATPTAAHNHD
ncbi:flagellar assembly protein FliH [Polaromonas sp. YR568]|uniref:flagellar assembly protein FliH n=1 Tax=Polaromonas sp. YR568 TaxID=1855301 RepID=UPI00398BD3D9